MEQTRTFSLVSGTKRRFHPSDTSKLESKLELELGKWNRHEPSALVIGTKRRFHPSDTSKLELELELELETGKWNRQEPSAW